MRRVMGRGAGYWIVSGDPRAGDAYPTYRVSADGCSCHEHDWGHVRARRGCGHMEVVARISPTDPLWGCPPLPPWLTAFRPGQLEAAAAVVDLFRRGETVVAVDAPTGSGKTVVAELVRRLLGVPRAVYLTQTRDLQDQLLRDFPYARLLKGRRNYVVGELAGETVTAEDCTKEISDERVTCRWCDPVSSCPYEEAKRTALEAPLAVLNTAYFLAEANHVGHMSGADLVIADEADALESALMSFVEVRVTRGLVRRLGMELPGRAMVGEARRRGVSVTELWTTTAAAKLAEAARDCPDTLEGERARLRFHRLRQRCLAIARDPEGWVYWVDGDVVVFRPVTVASMAHGMLWRHGRRWLLMSATLLAPDELAASLGFGYVGEYDGAGGR